MHPSLNFLIKRMQAYVIDGKSHSIAKPHYAERTFCGFLYHCVLMDNVFPTVKFYSMIVFCGSCFSSTALPGDLGLR